MNKLVDWIIFGSGSIIAIVGFGCMCGGQFFVASIFIFIGLTIIIIWLLVKFAARRRTFNMEL